MRGTAMLWRHLPVVAVPGFRVKVTELVNDLLASADGSRPMPLKIPSPTRERGAPRGPLLTPAGLYRLAASRPV